jgi:hypothetical protein
MLTREQMVKVAREAAAGIHRPSYCKNPSTFDPHEWVLEAIAASYRLGRADTAGEVRP